MIATASTQITLATGLAVNASSQAAFIAWLVEQAVKNNCRFLLAHAEDGVVWGFLDGAELKLSSQAFPLISPPLHPETLQQARLFGDTCEVMVWRDSQGLTGRVITEGQGEELEYYDTHPILWGDRREATSGDFVLLQEGEQGLRHAPPLKAAGINKLPARLVVRNYLRYEETGQVYVALSRLVSFTEELK